MRRAIYSQIPLILNRRKNQLRWLLKVRWLIVFGRLNSTCNKTAQPNQHNRRREYYISLGCLRYGFQLAASWRLRNLFKVSSLSFHCRRQTSWTVLLSTTSFWGCLPRRPTKRPSRAVWRCRTADKDLFMAHAWWFWNTFSSCISGILEKRDGIRDQQHALSIPLI